MFLICVTKHHRRKNLLTMKIFIIVVFKFNLRPRLEKIVLGVMAVEVDCPILKSYYGTLIAL